jgi:hypothetical protein
MKNRGQEGRFHSFGTSGLWDACIGLIRRISSEEWSRCTVKQPPAITQVHGQQTETEH